jgi:hypothetical protein
MTDVLELEVKKKKEFAESSKHALRWITKHYTPSIDATGTEKKYTPLKTALAIAEIDARFFEIVHTKQHGGKVRVLATSRSVRADEELPTLMQQHPEFDDFTFGTESPGAFLAPLKLLTGVEAAAAALHDPEEVYLNFTEPGQVEHIVRVVARYDFYKPAARQKLLPEEFKSAEGAMKSLVERFRIPGRYSWNARVDHASRPKRKKVDLTFLDKYGDVPFNNYSGNEATQI